MEKQSLCDALLFFMDEVSNEFVTHGVHNHHLLFIRTDHVVVKGSTINNVPGSIVHFSTVIHNDKWVARTSTEGALAGSKSSGNFDNGWSTRNKVSSSVRCVIKR
eukprot:Blabericola_migrator_1__12460@NODE_786_length_6534_cov_13_057214_g556_i0_p7_GENE_NODE_786_length_6534_cov_13_057214_g556_i0NODE_786_length_6534_cov_13_057214_g556_i0_p7_ORF_typecomplete_len105_score17_83_NODE_786_length_6534_cov_13_057214_g556_i032483562